MKTYKLKAGMGRFFPFVHKYCFCLIWFVQMPKMVCFFLFFLSFFFFQRQGEKHQYVVASHGAVAGDLAHNSGMCPDCKSNLRPFGLQPTLNSLSYTSQSKMVVVFGFWFFFSAIFRYLR